MLWSWDSFLSGNFLSKNPFCCVDVNWIACEMIFVHDNDTMSVDIGS